MSQESQANSPIPKDGILRARFELNLPPQTPVLLNDINGLLKPGVTTDTVDQAVKILIGTTYRAENVVYTIAESFKNTIQKIVASVFENCPRRETAVIWPGEGAKSVLRETLLGFPLLANICSSYFVPTERIVQNGKPIEVFVNRASLPNESIVGNPFRTFLIIDDVVATGLTLQRVRETITQTFGNNKVFRAITWFLRKPTYVPDYASVDSVYRYSTSEGWPALNSLSTLLRTDAKGEAVRSGYMKKYIRYPYGFRKQIDYIRSLTTIGGTP